MIELKAKEAVNEMVELMTQRITSMEKKLKIFDEELQKLIEMKIQTSQKILEKYIEELIGNNEKRITNMFGPRIDELES